MTASLKKIKKDLQELTEVDKLKKQILHLEKDHQRALEELHDLRKEVADLSKKVATLAPGGRRIKATPLIDVIEEIVMTREQPVKVVELREELLKGKRVKSKAENFYAVIATAMNNSPKFSKVGAGLYEYLPAVEQQK